MYKYIYIPEKGGSKASCPFITWVPVRGPLSPLESSMAIVQIVSKALHDANDALLCVHYITRITRPHFHCFSDPHFGALSPTKLWVHPIKRFRSTTTPPSHPLNSLRRPNLSIYIYTHTHTGTVHHKLCHASQHSRMQHGSLYNVHTLSDACF